MMLIVTSACSQSNSRTQYYALSECILLALALIHFFTLYRRYRNRAFVGTANGYVNVFTRAKGKSILIVNYLLFSYTRYALGFEKA